MSCAPGKWHSRPKKTVDLPEQEDAFDQTVARHFAAVDDIMAENCRLKARVAELEALLKEASK